MTARGERGFTLIETLVAVLLFGIASVGFYSVMFSGSRGSDTARSVVRIAEEARLGLNRMVRDTREAGRVETATPTSYRVLVDFNRNGTFDGNSAGNLEDLTFAYVATGASPGCPDRVEFRPGCITVNGERLVVGVGPIAGSDIFSYSSNLFLYDCNANGVTTWQELDAASTPACGQRQEMGNNNGQLDVERPFITNIDYAFQVSSGDATTSFYGQAQLRNLR